MRQGWLGIGLVVLALAGCAGGNGSQPGGSKSAANGSGGRYAMSDDAYPELPPDVSRVPDAVPRVEPRASSGNRSTYRVWGKTYHVLDDPGGYAKRGTASWYGKKFHGYATASGEIYDMYKMTAAHRSLPLPTYARVTNLDNGRKVIVKVNDRGPFHGDRLIDLSYAAAARLDILGNGTGRVKVEAIDPVAWQARQGGSENDASSRPQTAPSRSTAATETDGAQRLYLQVAALGSADGAQALRRRLETTLGSPVRVTSDSRMHRVQVGPVSDRQTLDTLRQELERAGYAQTFTVEAPN